MKYNRFVTFIIISILTTISGCTTTPTFPHYSSMQTGEPTAIDGLWQIQGKNTKAIFRIKRGIMYAESNIASGSFVKQGWVVARDIRLEQFPKFSVMPVSFKKAKWDYGLGEIELISRKHMILRYYPNSRTGLNRTIEETYENLSLAVQGRTKRPNCLILAGHGFPDPDDPEKVYFATYDTDIKIPATGYRMDRVPHGIGREKNNPSLLSKLFSSASPY